MKKFLIFVCTFLIPWAIAPAQSVFEQYFTEKSLRVDFHHAGTDKTETFYLAQIKQEPFWGGSITKLIDSLNYGDYMFKVYDKQSNKLLYSRGFSNLFREWQATDEAKTMQRSFYESVNCPFPLQPVRIELASRNENNEFEVKFSYDVDPKNYFISKEKLIGYETWKVLDNGATDSKLDIVFLAEGYTAAEMPKFRTDAMRFVDYLKQCSPYKENITKFNVWAVASISAESGVDIPGENIWIQNVFGSTFYTFDSERYLTSPDIKAIRDAAAHVPYDQIYILVNSSKYGGGGVYNYYGMSTTDNEHSEFVFTHELGHSFADLADEYYDSSTAYNELHKSTVEPYRPNITNLVNFDAKWKNMIDKKTPSPTPNDPKYKGVVGLFEGGGYIAKGMYRPYYDCSMNKIVLNNFCPVCQKAIVDMLKQYAK